MLPSTTASLGNGSIVYRSRRYRPLPGPVSSTIFTDDELMSTPINGGDLGFSKLPMKSASNANFPLSIGRLGAIRIIYIKC